MEIGFFHILTLVSIIQGFLLGMVILFSKFFKSTTNQYLGYSILIVSISSLNNWFWELSSYPLLIDVLDLILWQFLFPVTLFLFFVKAKRFPLPFHPSIVYLPFFVFTLLNILISFETHYQFYQLPITDKKLVFSTFYSLVSFFSVIYALLLSLFSGYLVFFDRSKLTPFSSTKWLKACWLLITSLVVLWAAFEVMKVFLGKMSTTVVLVGCSLMIYWLIYKGLYQFKLANDQFEIQQIFKERLAQNTSTSTTLNSTQQATYFDQVEKLLQHEKLYRNPDLGRDDIAQKLGISSGYLSQIINNEQSHSFSELINHYRIEEAKRLILDPEFRDYSLVAIGLEAGFKSKSNFYTSFKKYTGMTPGVYQKTGK